MPEQADEADAFTFTVSGAAPEVGVAVNDAVVFRLMTGTAVSQPLS